jgi:uncharacterized phage protein (TIGR02218 family)
MSKTISDELKAHLAEDVTTIATCWRIVRSDAQEFFFTDHDTDIVYDGDTYEAASGVLPQSLQQSDQFAVDNQQLTALLESDRISEADMSAGLFDYAKLDVFILNYEDLTQGVMYLVKDWSLGEIEIRDNAFTAEARGKAQHLQQNICQLYSADCRADLGDAQCQVNLALLTITSTVESVSESRRIFTSSDLIVEPGSGDPSGTPLDPVYQYGLLTWLEPSSGESYNGANAGYQMEVKRHDPDTGEIELFEAMPYTIEVGDEFSVTYGCDKSITTCKARFDNVVNFRGEPYIPGLDRMLDIATHKGNVYQDYPNPFN